MLPESVLNTLAGGVIGIVSGLMDEHCLKLRMEDHSLAGGAHTEDRQDGRFAAARLSKSKRVRDGRGSPEA